MGLDIRTIFDIAREESNVSLNVDKIKDIEDIKRILKFLNINVNLSEVTNINGFDEVKDLFGV